MVGRRQVLSSTVGLVGIAQLSGCSALDGSGDTFGLYVTVDNTDRSRSHVFSLAVRRGDSDPVFREDVDVPAGEDHSLGSVGDFEKTGQEDVEISVTVDSALHSSEPFDLTGSEFFVSVETDGDRLSFESGHGDA